MRSTDDLTARARIRDAALELFGADGAAGVGVRAVATAAGVSPALVLHHFGSKEGLRRACDGYVVEAIRGAGSGVLSDTSGLAAMLEAATPVRRYLARALLDGSADAAALFDEIVTLTGKWLADGAREGWAHPAADPHARAAVYVSWLLAPLVLESHLARALDVDDLHGIDATMRYSGAAVEMFTRGVFADDRALTAWEAVRKERETR
ncbi:TetR/AcrR family transcriptional regulator [Herbidospora yilanensis]|uniref:TetR/AcrR family transcriptional regulator n=1 Tax=Herbidospora yilanensis TaxID=354426 RepID=UPI0007818F95|nr:TetR family transcriptional regulator [Herbidospora yilanensis]